MAELVWKGKEGPGCVAAKGDPVRFRTDEVHGDLQSADFNRLLLGDRAHVLGELSRDHAGRVALVYIDPPFDTGETFEFTTAIPGAPEGTPRISTHAYDDARGLDAWLSWFSQTAVLLLGLLEDGGSLYVHLDAHVAHYAKVVLDEVFGRSAFQREIIWRIGWVSGFKSRARGWIRNHDTVLFYAKGGRPKTFHKEFVPYPRGYVRRDGKPPRGEGYPIEDVWNASDMDRLDSIQIMSFSGEKSGYPTQKNESLLARIVRASTCPGDLVLDCFVGSGTTAVAAERLGRRWLAGDASPVAIHVTRKRLLALSQTRPFVVESELTTSARETTGSGASKNPVAVVHVDGVRVAIELKRLPFSKPGPRLGTAQRGTAARTHWSQWLDGWCIDWDYRGGALRVGSSSWRTGSSRRPLSLSLAHQYPTSGPRVVAVKAFDILGNTATTTVPILIP